MIIKNIPSGKGRIAYAAELIAKVRSNSDSKPVKKKKPRRSDDGVVRVREWHEGDTQEKEVLVTLNKIYKL